MTLALDAVFPQEIISGYANPTAAVGSVTGTTPTNTVLLATADASDGSMITELKATPRATAVANVLALWGSKDGGTTKQLLKQVAAPAQTVSTSIAAASIDFGYTIDNPLFLAPGESLYCGYMIADPASGYVFEFRGRNM